MYRRGSGCEVTAMGFDGCQHNYFFARCCGEPIMRAKGVRSSAPACMPRSPRRNPLATALYVNAELLAVIALALISRGTSPTLVAPAMGQAVQPAIAGGAGIFVVPAQF